MKKVYIMRGIPGSGKSTATDRLVEVLGRKMKIIKCSADDYFVMDGEYKFDSKKLPEAHAKCFECFKKGLEEADIIVVDNTNLKYHHVRKYIDTAKEKGCRVVVLNIMPPDPAVAAKRNIHSVPEKVINKMFLEWHAEDPAKWPGVDTAYLFTQEQLEDIFL